MAGTNSLEIDIHNLFQEGGRSDNALDYVCQELVSKYEKSETLSSWEIEGLSHFLITAGRFDLLKKFYIKCLKRSKTSQFPMGYIALALEKLNQPLTEMDIALFDYMIDQQPLEPTTLQSPLIATFSKITNENIHKIPEDFQRQRLIQKTRLIEGLNQHRIFDLREQEEAALAQLIKLFPNDIDISLLKQAHLEKKADDILSRVITKKTLSKPKNRSATKTDENRNFITEMENNIQKLADRLTQESPEQLYNLGILAFQFDFYELCIDILNRAPETPARDWLKAEALLECGRYLDLLKLIERLERDSNQQPEAIYGITYLRALSYHALGQKDFAIHLLESLAATVPSYRSTEALLHEWRTS